MVGRTETLLADASALTSAGRLADAESAYSAILELDQGEYRAHLGLAECVAARGATDSAVDHLVDGARGYAERHDLRAAFALMTKALAIAPSRLDLHVDVAELEDLDGRSETAALRLENLARIYLSTGQDEEAELVLQAAAAFRAPAEGVEDGAFDEVESAPFINPHTGHATPAPRVVLTPVPHQRPRAIGPTTPARTAATPPPPPPTTRSHATPRPVVATPSTRMVRPSPLATPTPEQTRVLEAKPKRASRGRSTSVAPKWRPSTVTKDPAPRSSVVAPAPQAPSISKSPRPRKAARPIAADPPKRPSLVAAPSPKRGGKKLDALPPLSVGSTLAARLRATSSSPRATPGDEDRTMLWRAP